MHLFLFENLTQIKEYRTTSGIQVHALDYELQINTSGSVVKHRYEQRLTMTETPTPNNNQDTNQTTSQASQGGRGGGQNTRGRGRGRGGCNNRDRHDNPSKTIKMKTFKGESSETEFVGITLTVDGGPQQVDRMVRALRAYSNRMRLPKLSNSIAENKKCERKDFLKTNINPDNYMVEDEDKQDGSKKEDKALKRTEEIVVREAVALKLKRYEAHINGSATLCNILVGQCDDGVVAGLEKQTNYQDVRDRGDIIDLICMVWELYASGDFGGIRDPIHWYLQQYRKLFSFTQQREQDTLLWMKELSNFYDTLKALAGPTPFGQKLLESIIQKDLSSTATMKDYYDSSNKSKLEERDHKEDKNSGKPNRGGG